MKKKVLYFLTIVLFSQCSPSEKTVISEEATKDSVVVHPDTAKVVAGQGYEDRLAFLPQVKESSLEGLKLFSTEFKKDIPEENDKALKAYQDFQIKLIDVLNNNTSAEDLDKMNVLMFGDSAKRAPELIAFADELKQNALSVSQSEGTVFFESAPEVVEGYFMPSLSPMGKKYLAQYTEEVKQPYSEDAGLRISLKELGERVIFWNQFLIEYPDNIFAVDAKQRYDAYRSALMVGLDNTPAFDNESKKLDKEFAEMYIKLSQKYPGTQTAKIFKKYLEILRQNDNTFTKNVEKFVQEH